MRRDYRELVTSQRTVLRRVLTILVSLFFGLICSVSQSGEVSILRGRRAAFCRDNDCVYRWAVHVSRWRCLEADLVLPLHIFFSSSPVLSERISLPQGNGRSVLPNSSRTLCPWLDCRGITYLAVPHSALCSRFANLIFRLISLHSYRPFCCVLVSNNFICCVRFTFNTSPSVTPNEWSSSTTAKRCCIGKTPW